MDNNIAITIDPKQNRIRFYRAFLKELGKPQYVELMIDPEKKILAVKKGEATLYYTAKLNSHVKKEHCYELHCQNLIKELFKLLKWTDTNYSYKVIGTMDEVSQTAFFNLTTATKIDNEE